jgi:formamidopyrimidine-DNA glycosylase
MTGLVLIDEPPSREHLRFEIRFKSAAHPRLLFWDRRGLGSVRLYRSEEYSAMLAEKRVGIDALSATPGDLISRFGELESPIKVALLDQRRLAGVGNLYAAEILHLAKIHPALPCRRLSPEQWRLVHKVMCRVLRTAIRLEGSTLADGTYRNALNEPGGYQNRHVVYDREGLDCLQCGRERIVRIVQAQRATFFCPGCQPRPPASAARRHRSAKSSPR